MQASEDKSQYSEPSPIYILEDVFFSKDWNHERLSADEVTADAVGRWCNYRLYSFWTADSESLAFNCFMNIKIPDEKREKVNLLLCSFNPKVWLGHFEIFPNENVAMFRHTLTLCGNAQVTHEQVEEVVDSALYECERLFPALQFLLWGGKEPEEAILASLLTHDGEA